jgi:REP element-mobilizing transposase RayT
MDYKVFYKRNLPHYQPIGYTFFITFRLSGSLPITVIENFKLDKKNALNKIIQYDDNKTRLEKYRLWQSKYFKAYDKYLDKCTVGPKWLAETNIATCVQDAIKFYDNVRYNLISYCIMPNHVHLVIKPIVSRISDSTEEAFMQRNRVSPYIVTKILQDLKKYSATQCNKILKRSGSFWHHESYDHVVRNQESLYRIINYILDNPVKAGLVGEVKNWKYSYVAQNLYL